MRKFIRSRRLALAVALVTCAPGALAQDYQPKTPHDNTPWRFNMEQNGKRMTADEFDAWMRAKGVRIAGQQGYPASYGAPSQGGLAQPAPSYASVAPTFSQASPASVSPASVSPAAVPGVIVFGGDPAAAPAPVPSFVAAPLSSPSQGNRGVSNLGTSSEASQAARTPGAQVQSMSIKVASQGAPVKAAPSLAAGRSPGRTEGAQIGKAVIKVASAPAPRATLNSVPVSMAPPVGAPLSAPMGLGGNMAAAALPEEVRVGSVLAPPSTAPKGLPPGPGLPPLPPPTALPESSPLISPPVAVPQTPQVAAAKVVPGPDTDFLPLFAQAAEQLARELDNGMAIAVFKMDDPMLRAYMAGGVLKLDEQTTERLTSGFASVFVQNGQFNNATTPVCYLLYQQKGGMSIYHEFIAPMARADSPEAAARFLVAHEIAHCLDNYERELSMRGQMAVRLEQAAEMGLAPAAFERLFGRTLAAGSYPQQRIKLHGDRGQRQFEERLADAFAIGWLRRTNTDPKAIEAVLATRERLPQYAPHSTAPAIMAAQTMGMGGDLSELWRNARQLQRQVGIDVSLGPGSEVAVNPERFPTPDERSKDDGSRSYKLGVRGFEPIDGKGAPAQGTAVAQPKNFSELKRFGN